MDKDDIFRLKLTSYLARCDDGCHVGDIFHLSFFQNEICMLGQMPGK